MLPNTYDIINLNIYFNGLGLIMNHSKNVTVTFDSNVWENIVDPDKRSGIYLDLFKLVESKKITPIFFAGLAIFETIPKNMRKDYIANYKMSFEWDDGNVIIKQHGTKPYQLSEYHNIHLKAAFDMGFKFIDLPRIGAPKIPKEYMSNLELYPLGERLDRTFECARFIENELQAGYKNFQNLLDLKSDEHICQKSKDDEDITDKKYAAGVAEWMDGDSLAAHYGYGLDYYCTNDKGKGAGSNSIFHLNNKEKLKERFDIKILEPSELFKLLQPL